MEQNTDKKREKINKSQLISVVAKKSGMSSGEVRMIFDGIVDEIRGYVTEGKDVSLTGFGTFSVKHHKGHPVQFESKSDRVDDYVVLKFTPSDVLMNRIREDCSEKK